MRVLKEGTRLAGRYELVRRLGSGGMAEIWLAQDASSGRPVALKFLLEHLAQNPACRDFFRREWQTGSRLMHPYIVRLFEYHDDAEGPYYGQQFIDGPELAIITGQVPADALRPFALIADALRYAHSKGIVHRDIKASNVLLDASGCPYLIDFGVAAPPGTAATGGSPIASSPQQAAGEPATPPDDIYALGVLMHEVLTGAPPSAGEDGLRSLRSPLVIPSGQAVGESLENLLRDMLAPDPDNRPAAVKVGERLEAAGVAPGPAKIPPTSPGSQPEAGAEHLQSIRPTRVARQREPIPASGQETFAGVSPRVAVGGLALLLTVFLTVIFWLPDAVEEAPPPVPLTEEGVSAPEPAAPRDSSPTEAPADAAEVKKAADEALGRLLSRLERLRARAIEQWGGQPYAAVLEVYERGDRAYLDKDYRLAGELYEKASADLEPFFTRADKVFAQTLEAAHNAFAAEDHVEAVRLFELAVAITPGHAEAEQGLARARNLKSVLFLTNQAVALEKNLELEAARLSFEKALGLDPVWQPAVAGMSRVKEAIRQRSFEQRMSEGFAALASGHLESARVAFNAAKVLKPASQEPVDGLLQVDQETRLANIRRLEKDAKALEGREEWRAAMAKYQQLSEIDPDLAFVREGLVRTRERAAIHERLQGFIDNPDSLSAPATLRSATQLLLQVTTMEPTGARLEAQKNELSRLLKRAATPLTVQLVSDNATEVSIFKVGKLGTFSRQELDLRPGAYVATGSRDGYRDVRLEFRVDPEMDRTPIVIVCEEPI